MKFSRTVSIDRPAGLIAPLLADPTTLSGFDPVSALAVTPRGHDDDGHPTLDEMWDAAFRWRGAMRRITARRLGPAGPAGASYRLQGRQVAIDVHLGLRPVAAARCELVAVCEVQALSVGVRLLLQPLRLAQAGAQARFDAGADRLARHLQQAAGG